MVVNVLLFVRSQHTMYKYSVETMSCYKHTGKQNEIYIRSNVSYHGTFK